MAAEGFAIAAISFFLFPGLQIASMRVRGDSSLAHLISLAMLLSMGVNSMTLYLLGLLNSINLPDVILAYLAINVVAAVGFRYYSGRRWFFQIPKLRPSVRLALVLLAGAIWFGVVINSASWPFVGWDALGTFNPVALYILRTGSTIRFLVPGYAPGLFGPFWYPVGFPMSFVWAYLISGSRNENVAHLMTPFFMLILLGYSYLLGKEIKGSGYAAVLLVAISPTVLNYTLYGYADVAAGAFFVACTFYATRWMAGKHRTTDLLLSGLSAGLTAWVKPQGLFTIVALPVVLILLCITKRDLRPLLKIRSFGILLASEAVFLAMHIYTIIAFGPAVILGEADWAIAGDSMTQIFAGSVTGASQRVVEHLLEKAVVALSTLFTGKEIVQDPNLIAIMLLGVIYFFARTWRTRSSSFPAFLSTAYLGQWFVFTYSTDRSLVSFIGVAAALSSTMLTDCFDSIRGRNRIAIALVILVLLAQPAFHAATFAIQGNGPDLTWSLSHLSTPIDDKRSIIMGPMWTIAGYAALRPEIADSKILITDSRMLDWLSNATYALSIEDVELPRSIHHLCYFDYVISREQGSKGIESRLVLVHQDGDWRLYKVECSRGLIASQGFATDPLHSLVQRCSSVQESTICFPRGPIHQCSPNSIWLRGQGCPI